MISVHLTAARIGALQQNGLDPQDPDTFELNHDADERAVVMAWLAGRQRRLVFDDPEKALAAAGALDDLANAEDEMATREGDAHARRASGVLARLAARVRTAAWDASRAATCKDVQS